MKGQKASDGVLKDAYSKGAEEDMPAKGAEDRGKV